MRPPGRTPVECDRRAYIRKDHRPCHRQSSSMPSAPRSGAPSRARSPRCGRMRHSRFVIDQLLERNPGVDPASVEEVVAGCGLPQGLQANNIARIAVLLSEKLGQETNGITVSRYCASGLDAIRAAANNIVAGQGDVYIAGGVEFVSRYNARAGGRAPGGPERGAAGQGARPARRVHRDGADGGERRREVGRHPSGAGRVRPALAGARGRGAGRRLLRPRDRPRDAAGRHRRGQGRRPARRLDGRAARRR